MSGLEPGARVIAEPIDRRYDTPQEIRTSHFDVTRGSHRFRCELIDRGPSGWFAELFKNGAFDHDIGGPFRSREAAIAESQKERDAINR